MSNKTPTPRRGFTDCKSCRIILYFGLLFMVLIFALIGRINTVLDGGGAVQTGAVTTTEVGGPFSLVDHTGQPYTHEGFIGKYTLVYFGFTYCPDVCPTSLTMIGTALDQMDEDLASQIQVAFVTIDPERDTPEALASYVSHFHPSVIGLTGTPQQIKDVARAYRVYYAKARDKDAPADDQNYLMDHSSITYVMGPDGVYQKLFNHGASADEILEGMTRLMTKMG